MAFYPAVAIAVWQLQQQGIFPTSYIPQLILSRCLTRPGDSGERPP